MLGLGLEVIFKTLRHELPISKTFLGSVLPPVMENQMEKNMENEMETGRDSAIPCAGAKNGDKVFFTKSECSAVTAAW